MVHLGPIPLVVLLPANAKFDVLEFKSLFFLK